MSYRNWMGTLNNPTEDTETYLKKLFEATQGYVVGQLEKGENLTYHIQFYVGLPTKQRISYMKKLDQRAHWEAARDISRSKAYCQKEETREEGPFTFGLDKQEKERSGIGLTVKQAIQMSEDQLQELHPTHYLAAKKAIYTAKLCKPAYHADDVRGVWYYGQPGVGKSRKAYEQYPEAYRKAQNKWFDGYTDQETIILDDLDKLGGQTLGHYLKIWGDRYPCTGEIKGNTVNLQHKRFIITSNYTPEELWPEDSTLVEAIRRRFKCIHIVNISINQNQDQQIQN